MSLHIATKDDAPDKVSKTKLVFLPVLTKHDIPADRCLEEALGKLEGVAIMGYDKDGKEYFASSYADGGTLLWLMERMKIRLFNMDEGK